MASFGASWEAPLAHILQLWLSVCLCTFHRCPVYSGEEPCSHLGLEAWLVPDLNKMCKTTSLLLLKSLLLSSDVPPLLAHDHYCHNFSTFLLSNLAKSSYRWLPLQLHHTIGTKKNTVSDEKLYLALYCHRCSAKWWRLCSTTYVVQKFMIHIPQFWHFMCHKVRSNPNIRM